MTISLANIVAEAEKYVGAPYVYGGTTPAGWDCSGFVQYVLEAEGVSNVPRTSEQQWAWVQQIPESQLQPGDLVFAQFPGDNASPGHVGIYVGNGQVLSAEDPQLGTGYASLASWAGNIVGYGAIPGSATTGNTSASSAASATADSSIFGSILGIPGQITQFFQDADTFINALMWLTKPNSWLRIGAFLVGIGLLLFAISALAKVQSGEPLVSNPSIVPVPV